MPSYGYVIAVVLLSPAVAGIFRYLRHRAYLNTARYLCDHHGLPALRVFLQLAAVEELERPALNRRGSRRAPR